MEIVRREERVNGHDDSNDASARLFPIPPILEPVVADGADEMLMLIFRTRIPDDIVSSYLVSPVYRKKEDREKKKGIGYKQMGFAD